MYYANWYILLRIFPRLLKLSRNTQSDPVGGWMGRLKLHAIGSLDELRDVDLSGYSRCIDDRAIERLAEGYKDTTTKHQSFEKVLKTCNMQNHSCFCVFRIL